MEVESMPALPLCDIGVSQDKISSWLDDSDVSALLNIDDSSTLDLQSVPSASPQYLGLSSDSPLASPFTPPYSSPELPEMEGTFVTMEAPPLFDAQIMEVDMLFADSLASVNPELLPELERILSSVDTSISPPASPSDQVPPSRSSKKRKTDDANGVGVCLPRDQLLTMTSTEIEDYVCKLKSQRTLSAAEEKELKRQRRLIKNREYASQSRSRKKQYVDELEKQLEDVRAENSALKQQVGSLSDENKVLKKQISAIATTIKKSASLSSSASGISTLTKLTSVGAGRTNNTKTVSACLLAIMLMTFTFSIFWDAKPMFQFPSDNSSPIHFVNRKLQEVPSVPAFIETSLSKKESILEELNEVTNFKESADQIKGNNLMVLRKTENTKLMGLHKTETLNSITCDFSVSKNQSAIPCIICV